MAEAVRVVFRVTTTHGHKREGEEHEDEDNLAAREPELGLSVSSNCEDVDKTSTRGHLASRIIQYAGG